MADYYAILKRAIGGLAEPTGESRRSVYEKARTALVAQLKSFDPPLSASEITQQRLQLEDAIRKVESESAKGLLSQALNRAALPDRSPAAPAAATAASVATAPTPFKPDAPTPSRVPPRATPPTGQPAATAAAAVPSRELPAAADTATREPTGPSRPPLQRPQPTPVTAATGNTGAAASMRVSRPQFEPIARTNPEPDRATVQPADLATAPRPPVMPPPLGRDRTPTIAAQRRAQSEPADYEQEDVTQPVANRVLKKAVTDIDRLGTASHESARRARDALAATDTPLDQGLSSGKANGRDRKPLTARGDSATKPPDRTASPPDTRTVKRNSRWPMVIGLVVALAVVALGATALYMKREVIAAYIGTQKPILELVQRTSSEKPIVKSTDRLLPDDNQAKATPSSNVKVVTTQPISPTDIATNNPGGRTDVTPATPATPAPAVPTPTLPPGDVLPIAQKASLLEEAADGTSPPVQSAGKVIWQLIKTPAGQPDKPDIVRLQGRVEIPTRGISLIVTMEQNGDPGLQASHLIKLEFKLPTDFDNKSVARVPGMILKTAEQARGDPLAGATAKITSNLFWIALYAADADRTKNLQLIKDRGWIDVPIVYETNKRAMLTLEKAGAGDHIFTDALAAWGG